MNIFTRILPFFLYKFSFRLCRSPKTPGWNIHNKSSTVFKLLRVGYFFWNSGLDYKYITCQLILAKRHPSKLRTKNVCYAVEDISCLSYFSYKQCCGPGPQMNPNAETLWKRIHKLKTGEKDCLIKIPRFNSELSPWAILFKYGNKKYKVINRFQFFFFKIW